MLLRRYNLIGLLMIKLNNLLKILLLLLVSGCELPCAEINKVTDLGPLTDEVLELLPYENEEVVNFRREDGSIFPFNVQRETQKQYLNDQDECTSFTTIYEINNTLLTPSDSSQAVRIWVSNLQEVSGYDARVGYSRFMIPVSEASREQAETEDSLTVNDVVYYDVFRLYGEPADPAFTDSLQAVTMLFNDDFGILEVLRSDGSYYQLQQ